MDDGRGIPVASSHYILSQCDELSAAGGVLGGMGVQTRAVESDFKKSNKSRILKSL